MYTEQRYKELIALIKTEGYTFRTFTDDLPPKSLLLRHDIDYSVEWAKRFAEINHALGVTATFKFQLHSPLYNLHSYPVLRTIREIAALGQRIACHFTVPPDLPDDDEAVTKLVLDDVKRLQAVLPHTPIDPVISIHSPSAHPSVFKRFKQLRIEGFKNAYGPEFTEAIKYISDSNLRYTFEELVAHIRAGHARIQLLLHPFQWLAEEKTMPDVILTTMQHILTELEREEILTNHPYRAAYPHGCIAAAPRRLLRDTFSMKK
ncbi:hypothetical protein D6789_00575 [Candidatus Woesearchaeota archaeon]|nr:MAG: hypothetical protein D6789_00575 [Candidatus Woesearchaeota archaeon]